MIYATFKILKDAGGQLPGKEVIARIPNFVNLDKWDTEVYEKKGYIRWRSILHFYSIDCLKAGFLIKQKGIWYLTKEGEAAISLGEIGLLEAANKVYREWKKEKDEAVIEDKNLEEYVPEDRVKEREINLEQMEQLAFDGLKKYIDVKTPYEFQDLVAVLLRGMGYYTPFVALPGKDGGIEYNSLLRSFRGATISYKNPG